MKYLVLFLLLIPSICYAQDNSIMFGDLKNVKLGMNVREILALDDYFEELI